MADLRLVSHVLCPYVQRAAIVLAEKGVAFERVDVDLADKPAWFVRISPLGKTPVLQVGDAVVFESAVIVEYLDETEIPRLHPADPLARARQRSWMEFASAILNGIAGFYNAADDGALDRAAEKLAAMFGRVEAELGDGPWFAGDTFGLVDAAFGPVFRYFDTFDAIGDFGVLGAKPRVAAWRAALAARPSVRGAVGEDYGARLMAFVKGRDSALAARAVLRAPVPA